MTGKSGRASGFHCFARRHEAAGSLARLVARALHWGVAEHPKQRPLEQPERGGFAWARGNSGLEVETLQPTLEKRTCKLRTKDESGAGWRGSREQRAWCCWRPLR